MVDFALCTGAGCPLRQTCRRYRTAPDPENQTYFVQVPYRGGACDFHWPLDAEPDPF